MTDMEYKKYVIFQIMEKKCIINLPEYVTQITSDNNSSNIGEKNYSFGAVNTKEFYNQSYDIPGIPGLEKDILLICRYKSFTAGIDYTPCATSLCIGFYPMTDTVKFKVIFSLGKINGDVQIYSPESKLMLVQNYDNGIIQSEKLENKFLKEQVYSLLYQKEAADLLEIKEKQTNFIKSIFRNNSKKDLISEINSLAQIKRNIFMSEFEKIK